MIDVVKHAKANGWLVTTDPAGRGGSPQVTMVRSTFDGDRRVVFARLIADGERMKPSQARWMRSLGAVANRCRPHLSAYIWRPDDWPAIEEVLR